MHAVGKDTIEEIARAAVDSIPEIRNIMSRLETAVLRPLLKGSATGWAAPKNNDMGDWQSLLEFIEGATEGHDNNFTTQEIRLHQGLRHVVRNGEELLPSDEEMEEASDDE